MAITIDGTTQVMVRAVVKDTSGDPITSSTALEVTVAELLKGAGVATKAAAQANFAGADIAALKVELNAFLAKLRAAGVIAT